MGGVVVEPDFSTGIPGLFAAGEVTGGTFGAFRSGDGLTEMLVHGYVAGESAALWARDQTARESDEAEGKAEQLLKPFSRKEGLSPTVARAELEAICDEGFDFFRDGERLEAAYQKIGALSARIKEFSIPTQERAYNLEWINAFSAGNLALLAEAGIYAALNRRESRGTHLRADYPGVNNKDFLFSYTTALEQDRLVYGRRVPRGEYITLPEENYPTVSDYIAGRVLNPIPVAAGGPA
jgi:succinate dehydrogenase / fumarate reductase flavoprotein subunit